MSRNVVENPQEFFAKLGGMHDASIEWIGFLPDQLQVELKISDINSNFNGLSSYSGRRPSSLFFSDVQRLFVDTAPLEGIFIDKISIGDESAFFIANIYLNVGPSELSYGLNIGNIQIVFRSLEISADLPQFP